MTVQSGDLPGRFERPGRCLFGRRRSLAKASKLTKNPWAVRRAPPAAWITLRGWCVPHGPFGVLAFHFAAFFKRVK